MKYTKKISCLALLIVFISLISCSSNENENNTNNQPKFFKATIDDEIIDFGDTSSDPYPYVEAKLIDNKRLTIYGLANGMSLRITIGETFLEQVIQEDNYKIGTLQNDLESNLLYFNPEDTNGNSTASSEFYSGVYGCNVLSNNQVGEIEITTIDTVNKIVSGTFSGNLFRWLDVSTGESKTINLTNGVFSLPYTDDTVEPNPNKNIISAKVNGYLLSTDDPGSPDSRRSLSSGIDKIRIIGYDNNFGRIHISLPSNVVTGNNYNYQPDGSFQSLGVTFENRVNIPENLLSNNPNQSNDSFISIINHDPESNMIEGNFYIENSEIPGRTITDGYFKINYIDDVD